MYSIVINLKFFLKLFKILEMLHQSMIYYRLFKKSLKQYLRLEKKKN